MVTFLVALDKMPESSRCCSARSIFNRHDGWLGIRGAGYFRVPSVSTDAGC